MTCMIVNTEDDVLSLRPDLRDEMLAGFDRMIVRALTLRAKRSKGWFSAPGLEYIANFAGVEPSFARKRLRHLVSIGRIREAQRNGERGFIALPDCKFFRSQGNVLTDADRRFLAALLIAWDAPTERATSAAGGRGGRTEHSTFIANCEE